MAKEAKSPDDEWAVLKFLSTYAAGTQKIHRANLEELISWLGGEGRGLFEATEGDIERFLAFLRERGLKESTVRQKHSTMLRFYKFAEAEGLVDASPVEFVELPPQDRAVTAETLTRTELLACLEVARRSGNQDLLLWRVLAIQGFRVSEAVDLDVTDLTLRDGRSFLRFFNRGTQAYEDRELDDETASLALRVVNDRTTGPMFRLRKGAAKGHRMDRRGASRVVAIVAKRAGVTKSLSPRSLRATCFVLELQSGKTMTEVQRAFGVSDRRNFRAYKKRALREGE